MGDTPIELMAVLFALIAAWGWRRSAVCARVSLGVATVFALAAARYPGDSAGEIVAQTGDGLAWMVSGARGAGLAIVLVSLVPLLRQLREP